MKSEKHQNSTINLKYHIQQHILSSLFLKQSFLNMLQMEVFLNFILLFLFHSFLVLRNIYKMSLRFILIVHQRNEDNDKQESLREELGQRKF